jgi:hypothetical protein
LGLILLIELFLHIVLRAFRAVICPRFSPDFFSWSIRNNFLVLGLITEENLAAVGEGLARELDFCLEISLLAELLMKWEGVIE